MPIFAKRSEAVHKMSSMPHQGAGNNLAARLAGVPGRQGQPARSLEQSAEQRAEAMGVTGAMGGGRGGGGGGAGPMDE